MWFITGVNNDPGDKFMTHVRDTGKKFMTGVTETGDKCMTGVRDTSHKSLDTTIFEKVLKNSKWMQPNNQGPVGNWFMKKTEAENLISVYV